MATLDDVVITRQGTDAANIQYKKPNVSGVVLTIGEKIQDMNDQQILDCHNDCLRAQSESIRNFDYRAMEIPPNKPQVEFFSKGGYWVPRGGVLRGTISSDSDHYDHQAAICIDDKEFTIEEFGKMLTVYQGWGFRLTFVPEDALYTVPAIEIKDPDEDEKEITPLSTQSTTKSIH